MRQLCDGNKVRITDYYSDGAPVEIEVDENRSLQDEATTRFRQYTKSKRAGGEIAARLDQIDRDRSARSASATPRPDSRVEGSGCLDSFEKLLLRRTPGEKVSKTQKLTGVRRYLSTDGYEILVGRAARANVA